ncbi:helix-turn-helix transcriptional regulator [Roseomonas sp. KE2513]|uniref:ArsR/SmtB family transcription factor n=1 Tax=Roseomonas sp. KE2513 TaxID=2479202 RepID=UPI0018DFAC3B|nr:metalloregulator ArsR/SmtB family transcription factor [Roseomonas sp. KE2513]
MTFPQIDIAEGVSLLRALANPARLNIALHVLDRECSVGQIEEELGLKQPNLSQHLAEMRDVGLLVSRRESRMVFYRIAPGRAEGLIQCLRRGLAGEAPTPLPTLRSPARRNGSAATFAVIKRA